MQIVNVHNRFKNQILSMERFFRTDCIVPLWQTVHDNFNYNNLFDYQFLKQRSVYESKFLLHSRRSSLIIFNTYTT